MEEESQNRAELKLSEQDHVNTEQSLNKERLHEWPIYSYRTIRNHSFIYFDLFHFFMIFIQ